MPAISAAGKGVITLFRGEGSRLARKVNSIVAALLSTPLSDEPLAPDVRLVHSMIVGSGIDLVEIARIQQSLERYGKRFLDRIFTAC